MYFFVKALIFFLAVTITLRWIFYLESEKNCNKYDHNHNEEAEEYEKSRNDHLSCIRTYTLEEIKVETKNFMIKIGVGATSYVYLAVFGDGKLGAVKRVLEERGGSQRIFLDEISVMLRISHPNLVGFLGFCIVKGEQLLVLKYTPKKTVFDRMHTQGGKNIGPLSWSSRLNIALDVARAINYLHNAADPPIIHHDIKSSNILLIDDDHTKLVDFGLCKLGHDDNDSTINTTTPASIKGSFGYIDITYLTSTKGSSVKSMFGFQF